MTQQYPPKPWNVDDTFVNIETGVQYTFNGEQWLSGGSQYEAGYIERGTFTYLRAGDAFTSGALQNAVDGGSQPHNSLTRIKLHKTSNNGNTAPAGYYQPGQLLRLKKGADAAIYRITTVDAGNDNFYLIDVTFAGLQGQGFTFFLRDNLVVDCREIADDPLDAYLPLTGGELTGDLDVNGVLEVEGRDAFYYRNHTSVLDIHASELINGAILANAMYDPNNGYLKGLATEEYVDSKVVSPSPSSGRRFKYVLGDRVDDGCFAIGDYEILFSWVDLNGLIRKMPEGPDFQWTNFAKMTIWNAEGELWYAAELSKGSNWSSQLFRIYKDSVKLNRGLVVDEEYEITIEGYW